MPAQQPTGAQMKAFATDTHDGPVVMINLIKFRQTAAYPPEAPEAAEGLSGQEAYGRYAEGLAGFRNDPSVALEVLYAGPVARFFIGEGDWDQALVVRYPSRKHFLAMVSSETYQAAHRHREAGMLHQDLIETRPA